MEEGPGSIVVRPRDEDVGNGKGLPFSYVALL